MNLGKALTPILLMCLAACRPGNDGLELQADYLERLSNASEGAQAAPFDDEVLTRYRPPPRRDRFSDVPELRIGLLELLVDVRHCPQLQQLISLRNSSLGKQMVASRRLAYEGDLLRALDECLPRLRDPELKATLAALRQEKQRQLPAVFWNALNASSEFEHYLRFAEHALATDAPEDNAALDALAQLAHLGEALPTRLPPPTEELDPLFYALHASPQGGELITSLASLSHSLDAGSQLLETRLEERPPCPQGKPTERGRILQNIFVKYYAGGLQPYLAQVHQRGSYWQASIRQLSAVAEIPQATHQYLLALAGPRHSLWNDFESATTRHVRAWQGLLKSCGLAPGQSGWNGSAANAPQ
jgi:hypothetical protein